MKDSRFIELIKSLSAIDIADLKCFVNSPLFNKNKNISLLYDIVEDYSPNTNINEIKLYEKLNLIKKISKPNFRMVLSSFSDLIETYIVHKEVSRDNLTSMQYILKYAFDNDLQYLLHKTINSLDSYFLNKADLNANEKIVRIELQKIKFLLSKEPKIIRELDSISDSLHFETKLELRNYLLKNESKKKKRIISDHLSEQLNKSKNNFKRSDQSLYLQLILSEIRSGKPNAKKELEELFRASDSKQIKNSISEFLINDSSHNLNDLLTYVIWHWNNAARRNRLLNVDRSLFIAMQNHEMELGREIVKFIELNSRSNKGFFSKALYHFYFNDFTKCLVELEKVIPVDKEEDAQIRQLKMCCYVRLDHFKRFSNAYNAFKKFAVLNKDLEIVIETKKFCDILFRITSNKENPDNLLKIKLNISRTELINKNWLENELEFHFKKLA